MSQAVSRVRGIAAIITTVIAIAAPAAAQAAGVAPSQITAKAPSRLDTNRQTGNLPMTGANLLPETLIGVGLVGAGVGLRVRRKC